MPADVVAGVFESREPRGNVIIPPVAAVLRGAKVAALGGRSLAGDPSTPMVQVSVGEFEIVEILGYDTDNVPLTHVLQPRRI